MDRWRVHLMLMFNSRLCVLRVFLVLATGLPQFLYAASCKQVDAEALKHIILTTSNPRVVLIAASIGQQQVLAALRVRMQLNDLSTPEGAAEAAATRLGDFDAIRQLRQILKEKKADVSTNRAAAILGFAGTQSTLRIGFDYLLAHEKDPNAFKVVTDVPEYGPGSDFALFAVLNLEGLPSPNNSFASWVAWWKSNKKSFQVIPPSSLLTDATLQCYGRIAEWDIGAGVRELYAAGGAGTLPII